MKKNILVFTLTALALLCLAVACNLDAADGIYSEVAASTESTDVVTRSFVGTYADKYYFLSDEGLFRLGDGKIVANTEGKIIRSACLDASGNIVLLTQDASTLTAGLTYRAVSGTGYADPVVIDGTYRGLLTNGIAWDDAKIYKVSGSTATEKVAGVSVVYALESDGYAFFSVKETATDDYRFYVLDENGDTVFQLLGDSTPYVGFQPVGTSGVYMLISYDASHNTFKGYRMTSGGGIEDEAWFTLNSTNQYAYSTQIPSFCYTKDAKDYIVLKCSSYFDRYNITDDEIESIDKGFATNLRTAEITNIKHISGLIFVAGTKSSMLYEIDMENNSSKQL